MKQASSSGWWLKLAVAYLIIAVIVFFAALETGFLSEDYCILLLMKERGSFALLPSEHGIFMPMAFLFFNALFPVFGLLAWPYHAVFGLMHVANALLVAACMRRLADLFCPGFKQQSWLASYAGLIFLIFPYQTEVVTWISAGAYALSLFCAMWSLLLFLNWMKSGRPWPMVGAICLYLLACFTKEFALVFLLVYGLLMIFYTFGRSKLRYVKNSPSQNLFVFMIFLLAASLYFLVRYVALGQWIGQYGNEVHLDFRPALMWDGWAAYHAKFFLFYRVLPDFLREIFRFMAHHPVIFLISILLFSAGMYLLFRYRRPFPETGLLKMSAFFYLCFLACLIPALNLETTSLGAVQSDRYGYFASVFFCMMFVCFVFVFIRGRILRMAALCVFCAWLGVQTFKTNALWLQTSQLTCKITTTIKNMQGAEQKLYLIGLPESYQGVYAYRSGFWECMKIENNLDSSSIVLLSYATVHKGDHIEIVSSGPAHQLKFTGAGAFCKWRYTGHDLRFLYNYSSVHYHNLVVQTEDSSNTTICVVQSDGDLTRIR